MTAHTAGGYKHSVFKDFIATVTLHLVPKTNGGWQSDKQRGDSSIYNRGGTETEETLRCLQNEGGKVKPYSNVD